MAGGFGLVIGSLPFKGETDFLAFDLADAGLETTGDFIKSATPVKLMSAELLFMLF